MELGYPPKASQNLVAVLSSPSNKTVAEFRLFQIYELLFMFAFPPLSFWRIRFAYCMRFRNF